MADPTKREQILQALVRLWSHPSKPARLQVFRSPGRALVPPDNEYDREPWVALAILPAPAETETAERLDHTDGIERRLTVLTALRASDANIETLYALADETYTWLVRRIAASRAAGRSTNPRVGPLGGLCEDIREVDTPRYEVQDFDETYIRMDTRWEITFWTSEDDPREDPEMPE